LTQADCPDVVVVSDRDQNVARAMQVIDAGAGPGGSDTNAPTTFLVDGDATIRAVLQKDRFIARLSPDELLAAIDVTWPVMPAAER
jgi:alkyl hydroperoxide reductase subunit AhpC